ncbi:MAG: class I SAM-dependent methyltransferase [Blautia sp.]|mgnify:CR=1 FL=1|nr:class I SAM-dependent methyltransferase [Blautia sp.]
MDAYSDFARVYDLFMDNVDYEGWAQYIRSIFEEYKIHDGLVLDLGCGTGTMTELLSGAGYDMIGVDNSREMLAIAMEKQTAAREKASALLVDSEKHVHEILYLCQEMQEFELYGTVAAVVSVCDCINYVTEKEDLQEVFRLVNNYLDPGGIFLFDINTEYKYSELLGCSTIAENREEGSFIWENDYDPDTKINIYELTLFLPREDGLYEKTEELHYQRAYSQSEIEQMIKTAGMELLAVYDAYTKEPPRQDSERLTFIAREHGK